jgi:hypothetical protein
MHPHSSLTFRFQVGALAEVHPRSSPVSIRTHHDSIPRSRRCVRHRDFERRRGCFAHGVPRYVTTRDSITCIVRFIGTKTQCAVVLARPGCRFRRASSARSAIRCVPRDRSACLYYFGRFLRGFLGRLRLLSLPLLRLGNGLDLGPDVIGARCPTAGVHFPSYRGPLPGANRHSPFHRKRCSPPPRTARQLSENSLRPGRDRRRRTRRR